MFNFRPFDFRFSLSTVNPYPFDFQHSSSQCSTRLGGLFAVLDSFRFFDPSKTIVKPMKNQHLHFLDPLSPHMHASYLPSHLYKRPFYSFCCFLHTFSTKKRSGSDNLSQSWITPGFFEPSEKLEKPMKNQHFRVLAPPSPHIYALYLPSHASNLIFSPSKRRFDPKVTPK